MNNPFLLRADDRLDHWQQFRKHLSGQPEHDQFTAVGQYWSTAPLRSIAYDCDAPATWPSIWEMIRAGEWCRNSIAIGMADTLRLLGIDPARLSIAMLHDHDLAVLLMVVRIDTTWLLNYDWGQLTAYPKTNHRWVRRYHWTGRGYFEY